MSSRSMTIWASLTKAPSGPLTTPSMAVNCAQAALVNSKKQAADKMYPRDLASMAIPSPAVDFIKLQDTTIQKALALHWPGKFHGGEAIIDTRRRWCGLPRKLGIPRQIALRQSE